MERLFNTGEELKIRKRKVRDSYTMSKSKLKNNYIELTYVPQEHWVRDVIQYQFLRVRLLVFFHSLKVRNTCREFPYFSYSGRKSRDRVKEYEVFCR